MKKTSMLLTYILELNSKCTSCEIALNITEYRCYCRNTMLRKRSARANRSNPARLKSKQFKRY